MDFFKIIDNERVTLKDTITDLCKQHEEISIATGYWDLKAILEILEDFKKLKKIRLLIGREPLIPRHGLRTPENDFPDKDIKYDLASLENIPIYREVAAEIKKWIEDEKLEVKIFNKEFLHAKCYIFGSYDSNNAVGIIGSSNFTGMGLTKNRELNALEDDHRIVLFKPKDKNQEVGHLYWFDNLWNNENSIKWNEEFKVILETSPVGDQIFSPYEMYIKTLYELYSDELIDENLEIENNDKGILFNFQIKNVNSLVRKLEKYGVAMLSDSVGLGKTKTAINVIKRYLETEDGKRRVEIISPKSLIKQWEVELAEEEVFGLRPNSLQNVAEIDEKRRLDNIASVNLFVIDESHNLRNSSGKRFEIISDWIANNPKSKVLLVTATPINNQLTDLVNQLLIATKGNADILRFIDQGSSGSTQNISFYKAVDNLRKKINQDLSRDGSIDYKKIKETMTPILRAFVVRNTRQGIEKNENLQFRGEKLSFPKVEPYNVDYQFDKNISNELYNVEGKNINTQEIYHYETESIITGTKDLLHPIHQVSKFEKSTDLKITDQNPMFFVFQMILMLGFLPHRWMMYESRFYGKSRHEIYQLKLNQKEKQKLMHQLGIFGILRTGFLKRMESSVYSLTVSIQNYQKRIEIFKKGIDKGVIITTKDMEEFNGEDDIDFYVKEESKDIKIADNFKTKELLNDLEIELEIINTLLKHLDIINKNDVKIQSLADLINKLKKDNEKNKILVFSYFADTVDYLEKSLNKLCPDLNEENAVFLSSRKNLDKDDVVSRFSPKSQKYSFKDDEKEINYLISTDILSEGQNLQDAPILINYDLHWNPVRMIQRNGRINRIGSKFEKVFVYNMKPEKNIEEKLNLVKRLEIKINLIKNTIGTDTPVLDEIENPIEYTDVFESVYSEDKETRIKAIEEIELASDFLLSEDKFIEDLKSFYHSTAFDQPYKNSIFNIPRGKWGVFKDNNKQRKRVISLLEAKIDSNTKNIIGKFFFTESNSENSEIKYLNNLEALEILKTNVEDNQRSKDFIEIDRKKMNENLVKNTGNYFEVEETGSLIGQETDILRLMYDKDYSDDEINLVRAAFKTRNVFHEKKITKLKKSILKNYKTGSPYGKELELILETAKKIDQEKDAKNSKETYEIEPILHIASDE